MLFRLEWSISLKVKIQKKGTEKMKRNKATFLRRMARTDSRSEVLVEEPPRRRRSVAVAEATTVEADEQHLAWRLNLNPALAMVALEAKLISWDDALQTLSASIAIGANLVLSEERKIW